MIQRIAALLVLHDRLNALYELTCKESLGVSELGLV
jgi:hypothetical protein